MPRTLPEDKEALLKQLIRAGHTTRAIALAVGCGTGTVTRRKGEMGIEIRAQTSTRVTTLLASKPMPKGGRSPNLDALPKNLEPSAAAKRLAAFDPIVRRALGARPIEEDENGE
jgi:hypothetical protein